MSETVLGGIVIALVSAILGNTVGKLHKVEKEDCDHIRAACRELICTKIDNLGTKIEELKEVVNNKLFGL
jgi:predicted nucleic acid-binding Zn finger protein